MRRPGAPGLDPHRLDDLLELQQTGGGDPVGQDQPVADEIAVVQLLAEVAAVGMEHLTGRGLLPQPVVDPLPDETALAALMTLEQPLVLAQSAGAVAHGMRVLTEQEREPRRRASSSGSGSGSSARRPMRSTSAWSAYIRE